MHCLIIVIPILMHRYHFLKNTMKERLVAFTASIKPLACSRVFDSISQDDILHQTTRCRVTFASALEFNKCRR